MAECLVFSIEEFSVFDGPGIRTSVFLMGCPLRCEWCHNPEGQAFSDRILRSENGCAHCGACRRFAREANGETVWTEASLRACPQGLLRHCATRFTSEALCRRLEQSLEMLNASGGGVTFSGGEPTAHPAFLSECLTLLEGKTDRAVQTSGYCENTVFRSILSRCDRMLYDIKLVNSEQHRRYTGVSNEPILENLRTLAASGKPFSIRTPLIPTVTDTEENLRDIAALCASLEIDRVELLPYNRMAGAKYSLVGKTYSPSFNGDLPPEPRLELFAAYGVNAVIL